MVRIIELDDQASSAWSRGVEASQEDTPTKVMASDVASSQRHINSFSWNHHRQTFFNTIFNLRKEEVFCDVTLACDGVLFPAHRLVLAMCSEFFNEILTKVPSQQQMLVLVPTVNAEDLEALLTYIYRGEIQISQADLPSIIKAAKMLKIKELCNINIEEILWEQYRRCSGEEMSNKESREDNDSCESVLSVSRNSPEETTQESRHLPQSRVNALAYPQVEVFIDNTEEMHDMIYEGEEIEAEKQQIREVSNVWMKMEEEEAEERGEEEDRELDPLSVPLLVPHTLAFSSPNHSPTTFSPGVPLPVNVSWSEESSQDQPFNTTVFAASTSTGSRYTAEQKLEMVKNYYHYGPCKTARLMSELLGRKINESSVRSIVRTWIKNQVAVQGT